MPEVRVSIGGRVFEVACQEGEQAFLEAAAKLLDEEASVLSEQVGRMPESRMLLMAGLMLADKTGGLEEQIADLNRKLATMEGEAQQLRTRPAERVEVPVIPASIGDGFAELAARAEALADTVEEAL